MMGDRIACFGIDANLRKSEQKVALRKQEESVRIERGRKRKCIDSSAASNLILSSDTDKEMGDTASSSIICSTHKRMKKTGSDIHVPFDILKSSKLVSTAVRNNISPTALAATVESLITSCGGDTSAINLHFTQSYRYRKEVVSNIAERIHIDWVPPSPATIHWDGKLMETITDKYKLGDRLPVLISGVGGIKLLRVPALPLKSQNRAGLLISNATIYRSC